MLSLTVGIPLALVSLLGLLINIYILLVVISTKQIIFSIMARRPIPEKQTKNYTTASANNLLLLHLGLVDVLLCSLFLVFPAPGLVRPGWLASGFPCHLHGFLITLLHPVALWTLCGLNCDRFYAISSPLHYGALVSTKKVSWCMVSTKKVAIGLCCGWVAALALCLPPLFAVAPFRYSPGLGACAPHFAHGEGALWYAGLYTAVTLLIPAALIVGCNIKVLMIARYHRHRIASAIYEVTLSAQVTITHQRNPFFVPSVTAPSAGGPKFRARSPISTVLQLLGSFLVLYFPYYIVIMWESFSSFYHGFTTLPESKLHNHFVTIASTLITCSPPINGLLYGIKSKIMRKTFQNYWRKQMSKSEVIQEIQARTPSTCGSRRPSLTPLGVFHRPTLQRRLSEALLDVRGSPHRPPIKRIASELSWRPTSTLTFSDLSSPSVKKTSIPHTASCNTLQVPSNEDTEVATIADEELYMSFKSSFRNAPKDPRLMPTTIPKTSVSTANLLLQRVFGLETECNAKRACTIKTILDTTPRKSPRILITRAFSEESDKSPSLPGTPAKENLHRKYSSSTVLMERKWKVLRYKENVCDSETELRKPAETSSNDSSTSESSKRYSSLDDKGSFRKANSDVDCDLAPEEQLLLSWPITKKKLRYKLHSQVNGTAKLNFKNTTISVIDRDHPEAVL